MKVEIKQLHEYINENDASIKIQQLQKQNKELHQLVNKSRQFKHLETVSKVHLHICVCVQVCMSTACLKNSTNDHLQNYCVKQTGTCYYSPHTYHQQHDMIEIDVFRNMYIHQATFT